MHIVAPTGCTQGNLLLERYQSAVLPGRWRSLEKARLGGWRGDQTSLDSATVRQNKPGAPDSTSHNMKEEMSWDSTTPRNVPLYTLATEARRLS